MMSASIGSGEDRIEKESPGLIQSGCSGNINLSFVFPGIIFLGGGFLEPKGRILQKKKEQQVET